MRQVLGRDLSKGNRIANKNLQEANIVLASNYHAAFSPQETSRTKSVDMPIQIFPSTTKNHEPKMSGEHFDVGGIERQSSQAWEED